MGKDLKKELDQKFNSSIILFILVVVIILFFPIIFTLNSYFGINFRDTGGIGATIGGILGPFVAIAAAYLTFIAFWEQYKANALYRKDIELERFERKYYELLRLHKENVLEIDIAGEVTGRKAFMRMFFELKFIYLTLNMYNNTEKFPAIGKVYNEYELSELSYIIFFNGIGPNSDNIVNQLINKSDLAIIENTREYLTVIQDEFLIWDKKNPDEYFELDIPHIGDEEDFTFEIPYLPFDGHATRLGHYFRHLFQTVNFVATQEDDLMDLEQKREYLKTLRAQLSNHEQLILYYNSLHKYGKPWYSEGFLTNYRMIHNLPVPFADFGVLPLDRFKDEIEQLHKSGEELFEWYEIK